MTNYRSKSESESPFFDVLRRFLVEKLAQVDFDLAHESSSSSESPPGLSFESGGVFFSRGMMAPDAMSNVSSSIIKAQSRSSFS